jgi:hypothetical protein
VCGTRDSSVNRASVSCCTFFVHLPPWPLGHDMCTDVSDNGLLINVSFLEQLPLKNPLFLD